MVGKEMVLSEGHRWWSRTAKCGLGECDCRICFRTEVLGEKNGLRLDFLVCLVVWMYCLMGLELVLLWVKRGEQE